MVTAISKGATPVSAQPVQSDERLLQELSCTVGGSRDFYDNFLAQFVVRRISTKMFLQWFEVRGLSKTTFLHGLWSAGFLRQGLLRRSIGCRALGG